VAHGLDPERLERQLEVVEALNADLAPFRILTGIEVDILGTVRSTRTRPCSPGSTSWWPACTRSSRWSRRK
jgi:putative hydrolase